MRVVIQRVKECELFSEGKKFSEIKKGMLVLLGVGIGDTINGLDKLVKKIASIRIFDDENGKINKNVNDIGGEIMVVSNFTLYGNLKGTNRPDFINSAKPDIAEQIYEKFVEELRKVVSVKTGVFRTYMEIKMVADGPGTYIFDSENI